MRDGNTHIGDEVEVRARRKGATQEACLGRVVVEDLRDVLTRLSTPRGRSGPQGPMTQFLVCAAADRLAAALLTDGAPPDSDEAVARVLSGLVGHERFVTELGLSVHHMRRRWPFAIDWYADLLAYVLRPGRCESNVAEARSLIPTWFGLSLGDCLHALARHQIAVSQDSRQYQLADSIQWLWPTHPAVRAAQQHELRASWQFWGPWYSRFLENYGLRPRPGVSTRNAGWMLQSLITVEAHQRLVDPDLPTVRGPDAPLAGPLSADATLVYLVGATESLDGRYLTPAEAYARAPVAAA